MELRRLRNEYGQYVAMPDTRPLCEETLCLNATHLARIGLLKRNHVGEITRRVKDRSTGELLDIHLRTDIGPHAGVLIARTNLDGLDCEWKIRLTSKALRWGKTVPPTSWDIQTPIRCFYLCCDGPHGLNREPCCDPEHNGFTRLFITRDETYHLKWRWCCRRCAGVVYRSTRKLSADRPGRVYGIPAEWLKQR
jgi:hypothetical protein